MVTKLKNFSATLHKSSQKTLSSKKLRIPKNKSTIIDYSLDYSQDEQAYIAFAPSLKVLCKGDNELQAVTSLKKAIDHLLNDALEIPIFKVELQRKHA